MTGSRDNEHKAPVPAQSQRFIDKARELGCDEDEAAFEDKLRQIVPKPKKKDDIPERD